MTNSAPPNLLVALVPLVRPKEDGQHHADDQRAAVLEKHEEVRAQQRAEHEAHGGSAVALELVTDLAPGQPDEDVLESHLAVGYVADPGVVLVLLDQVMRRLGG